MRRHKRKDFAYTIVKGRPIFCRAAYACVITQATAYPDERSICHVETFYGDNGVKVRAEALRYGSAICSGKRQPCSADGYRTQHWPSRFPRPADLPKFERDVEIRYATL